jgi:hypothetical protein
VPDTIDAMARDAIGFIDALGLTTVDVLATSSGPRPVPAKPGKLACTTCGLPLDPILARIGRHIGC